MAVRHMTDRDAEEAAVLISESIQYADAEARRRTGDPEALAFPRELTREWTAVGVLAHRHRFGTSAVYEEGGRIMAVVIAQYVRRNGETLFNPVIGGTRISEIAPAEHEAYLYKPLELLFPQAEAAGITRQTTLYSPTHKALDDALKTFDTASGDTIQDRGAMREYTSELRLAEIRVRTAALDGRDTATMF